MIKQADLINLINPNSVNLTVCSTRWLKWYFTYISTSLQRLQVWQSFKFLRICYSLWQFLQHFNTFLTVVFFKSVPNLFYTVFLSSYTKHILQVSNNSVSLRCYENQCLYLSYPLGPSLIIALIIFLEYLSFLCCLTLAVKND